MPVTVAVAACALALGLPSLAATSLLSAGASAANAADAAALAAADAALGAIDAGVDATDASAPCALAAELAARNGVNLVSCVEGSGPAEFRITVTAGVGPLTVTRRARAGPP